MGYILWQEECMPEPSYGANNLHFWPMLLTNKVSSVIVPWGKRPWQTEQRSRTNQVVSNVAGLTAVVYTSTLCIHRYNTVPYVTIQHPLTLHFRSQKRGSLTCIGTIGQMRSSDDQSTSADHVSRSTEHLDLVLGVVGDLSMVLHVAGESKQNNPFHLGLETTVKLLNGVVNDGTSLTADQLVRPPPSTSWRNHTYIRQQRSLSSDTCLPLP